MPIGREVENVIKIDSITKDFETVRSLDGVSLLVNNGSIFGLIGSNGSGKSTLLKIMCGVYKPSEGDILYDGVSVWENEEVKRQVVYLSDDQYFLPHCTPADMARLYGAAYPTFSMEKFRTYMKAFNLEENRRVSTFSKGMQKQVSFILGLAAGTRYIFCDETLDGLDPVMRQTVRKIIAAEVAERQISVVFASHNLKEIEDICDHVALLHKGKLVLEADVDDVKLGIHKIQASFPREMMAEAKADLEKLDLISLEERGSLITLTARGQKEDLEDYILARNPLFTEFIPLTLEEIFIAEMEEHGYEFSEDVIG